MSTHGGNHSRRLAVGVLSVAQFVVVLDATAVTTALPAIGADLGSDLTGLQWVLSAYTLAFAGFLVVGGRLSDVIGARRTFAGALIGFTLASVACGLAPGLGVLVAARLVQGLAAALLSPAALSLLGAVGDAAEDGRRAGSVAVWTAVGAGGGASGWVVGGLLAGHVGWRWVFWVNLPVGLAALALVRRCLSRTAARHVRHLDLTGAVAATVGLGLLVWGLTHADALLGAPAQVLGPLVAGVAVLAWFRWHERRTADPLLPPTLLADRAVRGANLTALLSTTATTSAIVLVVLYLADVLRLPPERAAWYFPAFNLTVVAGSLVGPRVLARVGPRRTSIAGFVLIGLGSALLPVLVPLVSSSWWLTGALGLMGVGLGLTAVTSTSVGLAPVGTTERGVASGVLTSAAQVGNGIGFAAVVPFSVGAVAGAGLGSMSWGFVASAATALLGAAMSRLLPSQGVSVPAGPRAAAERPGRAPEENPATSTAQSSHPTA